MKLALLATALLLAVPAAAQDYSLHVDPQGGASGGPAVYVPNGDILNVRNIQGGSLANPPESLNLDIGAGSTANPGDIALNYDVGRRTLIFDGHKHLLASFGPDGIRFYVQPTEPRQPSTQAVGLTHVRSASKRCAHHRAGHSRRWRKRCHRRRH